MERRLDFAQAYPEGMQAMRTLSMQAAQSGLDKRLLELVEMRASQINGCAFCLDMHARAARAAGETEQRLYLHRLSNPRADPRRKIAMKMFAAVLSLVLAACAAPMSHEMAAGDEHYRAVLADPVRTERDHRMDASRHPVDLLKFAQVRPGMHVLDVSAGAGYTSQVLALAVGPSGKVWAQTPKPSAALTERMAAHPQANLVVAARPFDDPVPPDAPPLDLVTLVLNYHDISYLPVDRDAMNRKIFAALKPGGHYVIVDHSALAGSGIAAGKTLHRIDEAFVIREVARAGFALDAEGTFMRNAADARTTSSNQPPASDKFVLRFVKR